jgi:hypothetical protein
MEGFSLSSYSLNSIAYVSRIADWVLFGFIAALSFTCLFTLFNVYCFLALLCLSLLCLPKAWFKHEFEWRFSFFLSAGAFFIAFLIQRCTYIYIIGVIFPLILSALLFDKNRKWLFSKGIEYMNTLVLAMLLTVIALLAGSGISQVHGHLIGVAIFFIMLFALKYVCTAIRRETLLKCLLKIGEIKNPADFIEQILKKKSNISDEEKDFIRFRFNEFLQNIEGGEFQQAYITLSTGTLEFLNIWKMKKNENPKGWAYSHDKIRGALVHSTPPPKTKGKEIIREEAKLNYVKIKKEIIKTFAKDPFTPLNDLLEAAIKYTIKVL